MHARPAEDVESVEKMDITLRRIVGPIAMGLLTGALLKLIHRALQRSRARRMPEGPEPRRRPPARFAH